jgi:hypothetical protein
MPGGRDHDAQGDIPPHVNLWHRLLLALPRLSHAPDKAPLGVRLRNAIVKPVEPSPTTAAKDRPPTVEELEAEVRFANDRERLVGLFAAPLGAAIALVVIGSLIAHDPSALLKNGKPNRLHVSVSLYHNLTVVLLALSLVMLVTAFYRKRLFLGMSMALYGLAVFNLHYWGFGIPFLFGGAWLLVRSYRLQRDLREATGDKPAPPGPRRRGGTTSKASGPTPNKRYTPRTPPKRSSPPKPENEQRAG